MAEGLVTSVACLANVSLALPTNAEAYPYKDRSTLNRRRHLQNRSFNCGAESSRTWNMSKKGLALFKISRMAKGKVVA